MLGQLQRLNRATFPESLFLQTWLLRRWIVLLVGRAKNEKSCIYTNGLADIYRNPYDFRKKRAARRSKIPNLSGHGNFYQCLHFPGSSRTKQVPACLVLAISAPTTYVQCPLKNSKPHRICRPNKINHIALLLGMSSA